MAAERVAVGDAHEAVDDDGQPVLPRHAHRLALAVHAQPPVPVEHLREPQDFVECISWPCSSM